MSGSRSPGGGDAVVRLKRCIRDLAALDALPSMCIGRSPEEALDIMLDALPTALACDLVYLAVPGSPPVERASLRGAAVSAAGLPALRAAIAAEADGTAAVVIPGAGSLWCLDADVRVGAGKGRLYVGRSAPLDPDTDRVLVRSAANLVGMTLQSARVLDVARRKDEFLAVLGHELRNPLAPILTAVELLARQPAVAREQRVIERHTRHLARLVDDLLDISRVTRGHIELRRERVSIKAVLERAIEIAAPLAARHGHALRVAQAGDATVEGDPVRLAQVFGNLLTNAAKFTPAGGHIDVLVKGAPGRVRVEVRDDGRGLGADQLDRIFEPFVQADRERDALSGGLGLGLAIVKSLVERHGGAVSAHSEGRGRGAMFAVELPTIAAPPALAEAAPPRDQAGRGAVRVLVVDDNVDIAELLSEALEWEGFKTAVAHDARSALETWRRFGPHAAVLDLGMPEIDGYDLARVLRAEQGVDLTLIAATGYGQPQDRARAEEAGFDCHLVKPVSIHDLVAVLDERVVHRGGWGAPAAP